MIIDCAGAWFSMEFLIFGNSAHTHTHIGVIDYSLVAIEVCHGRQKMWILSNKNSTKSHGIFSNGFISALHRIG